MGGTTDRELERADVCGKGSLVDQVWEVREGCNWFARGQRHGGRFFFFLELSSGTLWDA